MRVFPFPENFLQLWRSVRRVLDEINHFDTWLVPLVYSPNFPLLGLFRRFNSSYPGEPLFPEVPLMTRQTYCLPLEAGSITFFGRLQRGSWLMLSRWRIHHPRGTSIQMFRLCFVRLDSPLLRFPFLLNRHAPRLGVSKLLQGLLSRLLSSGP